MCIYRLIGSATVTLFAALIAVDVVILLFVIHRSCELSTLIRCSSGAIRIDHMELANLWQWEKRKLPCKIRPETGNPSGDALRERLAELAGVNLQDLLSDMKNDKKRKEAKSKVAIEHSTTKTYNELLGRFHIIGASEIALNKMSEPESAGTVSKKNINKMYLSVPKSPPRRVLMDIQRERAKPLRLPDSSEEKNLATVKLEKKLAKQRAARMAAKDEAAKETEIQKKAVVLFTGNRNMQSVLRKYEGDRFSTGGEYMEGMLYLSRMPSAPKKPSSKAESQAIVKNDSSKAPTTNANGDDESEAAFFEMYNVKNSPDDEASSKLYCATALCNWARNASNAPRLANEGAVRAIMQLSNEKVARISVFCAGAFRYMSEHQILAEKMIEDKAINSISEMISSNNDDFICGNLAICLLNLTRLHGREGQLVEDSIVLCFMNIISQRPELLSACCRGLYNLTCVDASYPMMERVIRCLVSLSSNASTHVKHICAAALCNLGDLKGIRLRMVEEGVISVLGTLARGSETKTRRVCAVILQNLAATRACRTEMVSRNCVQVAYGLSSDQDPIILRCIGLALSRLALESQNSNRIISDGGVLALCNIAVKYPTIPGISQPVAVAFQLLSSRQAVRVLIVQEGSVAAIAALLRLSGDVFTLQHGMLALCNLLSSPENHLPIVQQGLVSTLILLSSHDNENLKDFCALAYFNLSCAEDSRKHIVNAGAIISIIKLSEHDSSLTKRRCAATLCNIAAYETGMYRMVQDGIIPALVRLLVADDIETVRYSCAAICRLSSTVENGRLILESGAIPNVVQGAMEGDTVTKQFCCAVLSALTFYEGCREALCDMGIIAALQELANLGDDTTKQRCLVAYANLSCADSIQRLMVKNGVVKIIADLADSYQETNQKCCALALCNLASQTDSKLQVIKEGGVQALMMISMVRSVEISTKLLCVRALTNLLEASTVKFLIDEGIVGALANLCKLASENIVYLCAQLFNQLSYYEEGRAKIIAKTSAVKALFDMFHTSPNKATKVIVARTTCNLVLNAQVRTSAIENGALDVLTKGIQLDDNPASMHCIMACFYSSLDPNFRVRMVQSTVTHSVGVVALEGNPAKLMLCAKTLCALAWAKESRAPLQNAKFASVIMKLVNKTNDLEPRVWITQILYYISINYKDYAELLELGMLLTLRKLCATPDPIIMRCIASILRCFCVNEYCINILANVETVYILKQVASSCEDKESRYNITVALNAFANNSSDARHRIAVPETIELLYELGQSKEVGKSYRFPCCLTCV